MNFLEGLLESMKYAIVVGLITRDGDAVIITILFVTIFDTLQSGLIEREVQL
jgi:hypothetical protein